MSMLGLVVGRICVVVVVEASSPTTSIEPSEDGGVRLSYRRSQTAQHL